MSNPVYQLARRLDWPTLPRRTVRLRLTAIYGGLFLLSDAALLAVTYLIVAHFPGLRLPPRPLGAPPGGPYALVAQEQATRLHDLLVGSAIASAVMAAVSVWLGWLVAGRVLQPLRTITAATKQISEDNLHQRLAMAGPDDEIKGLAGTIGGLLAGL
jgi:HAMP domain-containing protein